MPSQKRRRTQSIDEGNHHLPTSSSSNASSSADVAAIKQEVIIVQQQQQQQQQQLEQGGEKVVQDHHSVVEKQNQTTTIPEEQEKKRLVLVEKYNQLIKELNGPYQFIRALLNEFWEEFQKRNPSKTSNLVIANDSEWFWFCEMKFLVIFLYEMAFMEFSLSVTKPDSISIDSLATKKSKEILSHRKNMQERVQFLSNLKNYLQELSFLRLSITKQVPRFFRLAKRYHLNEKETELFQLLVVLQGCQSSAVRCQMIEEDASRKMTSCQRLAGISEIDIAEFYDDQREHVKEGTLIVDEENYCTVLSLSNICVRVLLGRKLSSNQVLKLSQTALEDLLKEEGMHFTEETLAHTTMMDTTIVGTTSESDSKKKNSKKKKEKKKKNKKTIEKKKKRKTTTTTTTTTTSEKKRKRSTGEEEDGDDELTVTEDEEDQQQISSDSDSDSGESTETDCDKDQEEEGHSSGNESSAFSFIGEYNHHTKAKTRSTSIISNGEDPTTMNGTNTNTNTNTIATTIDKTELKPYNPSNQLEYLEDRFQVVAFAIRASGARVKDQMKEAGTKQPWENSAPASAGRRELKAKQRVYDRRTLHRLALTRQAGFQLPRLEELAYKFKLNKFEQNVIVMLIGKTISPVIKNLIDGVDTSAVQRMDESIIINQILSVFCDTFQEQVAHRVYFYKSSRLLSRGLVKLHRGRWHSTSGDLVDQRVELDRRVLDWVVGLDTEINELVEGSDLYNPKVKLDQVVLPEDHKHQILQTVESYEAFRQYRKKTGLEDTISYGTGLVLLLCGASGTGKTMTVNAVAHHLKKRVLLVDFPSLQGKRQENMGETDADLRGLFREAEMSNAVLFFDECETIFKQRDHGGDRLLNALLTEIERYEGIVFLATNRPFDLDEAMHRRITAVFEFKPPDHIQRRKIWQVLLNGSLKTSQDIDWDAISLKYELSGGFIKNAILSALLKALSRNPEDPVITHKDIVAGCALQMRGSLHMKTFDHRVVPTKGLEGLILEEPTKKKLLQIVQFEKARSVIYGQWGFDFGDTAGSTSKNSKQKGISVLLMGPPGIGKLSAAKGIGFEIGKPLKVVHFAQLQSESIGETRKHLRAVFDDARLMDAVLVLEGFECFGSHLDPSDSGAMSADSPRFRVEAARLLDLMENFPGITILIASIDKNMMSSSVLHTDFCRRLKFIVEMKSPNMKMREELWRKSFPPQAPLDKQVDFKKLAERFDLSHAGISNAVFRGAANAALREEKKRIITMKDLMEAAEIEKQKAKGTASSHMDNLFV